MFNPAAAKEGLIDIRDKVNKVHAFATAVYDSPPDQALIDEHVTLYKSLPDTFAVNWSLAGDDVDGPKVEALADEAKAGLEKLGVQGLARTFNRQ